MTTAHMYTTLTRRTLIGMESGTSVITAHCYTTPIRYGTPVHVAIHSCTLVGVENIKS